MRIHLYVKGKCVGYYNDNLKIEAFRKRLAALTPKQILSCFPENKKID